MIYGVKAWAIFVGLGMIGAVGIGTYAALAPAVPPKPEPCRDTMMMSWGSSDHECPPGSMLQVFPAGKTSGGNEQYLVKCLCLRPVPKPCPAAEPPAATLEIVPGGQ